MTRDPLPMKRPGGKRSVPKPPPAPGRMAASVAELVASLDIGDDHRRSTLAQLALTLAAHLDDGAGMAAAAVAKELRATLTELEGDGVPHDDDAFARWEASLADPA